MAIREVIFRGKRADSGEWVEGILFNAEEDTFIIPHGNEYSYDPIEGLAFDVYGCKVDPETVGQYTGLTDKNGVRIFEGDIVERVSDGEQAVISWLKYSACFGLSFDGWCCGFDNYDDNLPSDFEVIGNIHDNSEILKTPSL